MTRVYKNKNDRGSCLPQFYFALPLLLSCGQPRAHPRRCAPPPLYGAGVSSPPGRRQPGNPGSRDPVPGTPARYRGAPARGVDVKPSPGDPGTGVPAPLEGPGGASGRLPRPREGSWPARGPRGAPGPVPDRPARGVLHQPLAPGPRGSPGRSQGPPGPGRAKTPKIGDFGQKAPKSPFLGGLPAEPRKRPFLGLRGATGGPPRGVDVKPPRGRVRKVPKPGKSPDFGEKGPKSPFWPKNPIFGVLGRFRAPWGLPRPPPLRGFTSTPRGGAPRFPGVPRRALGPAPSRGGVPAGGGAGGLPLREA